MTDLQFPTTSGSSIRAVPRDYSLFPPRVMFLVQAAGPELTVWIPEHSAVDRFAEHELTLVAVIHDEGYAKLRATLPPWGDLTDRDKGAVALHASMRYSEGAEYAEENYSPTFFDHPVLTQLQRADACRYVAAMEWAPVGPDWTFYDVHPGGSTEDVIQSTLGDDEFRRLYDLALDAERTS